MDQSHIQWPVSRSISRPLGKMWTSLHYFCMFSKVGSEIVGLWGLNGPLLLGNLQKTIQQTRVSQGQVHNQFWCLRIGPPSQCSLIYEALGLRGPRG